MKVPMLSSASFRSLVSCGATVVRCKLEPDELFVVYLCVCSKRIIVSFIGGDFDYISFSASSLSPSFFILFFFTLVIYYASIKLCIQ